MTNETITVLPAKIINAITITQQITNWLQQNTTPNIPELKNWMITTIWLTIITLIILPKYTGENPLSNGIYKTSLILIITTITTYTTIQILHLI